MIFLLAKKKLKNLFLTSGAQFWNKKTQQTIVNFFNEWCPILGQKKRSQPFVNFLTSGAHFWDKKTQPTICEFFLTSGAQFWDKKTQPTICKLF